MHGLGFYGELAALVQKLLFLKLSKWLRFLDSIAPGYRDALYFVRERKPFYFYVIGRILTYYTTFKTLFLPKTLIFLFNSGLQTASRSPGAKKAAVSHFFRHFCSTETSDKSQKSHSFP
jgi:hypothetical protein